MPLPGDRLYANAIWIGPANTDNYMVGRAGYGIYGIVDHHSASTLQGLINRFENPPAVSGGGASAHFAIDREEELRDGLFGFTTYAIRYQLVDTADMAFADSNYFENLTTCAIEHVRQWGDGPGTAGYEPITEAQYRSSAELHLILSQDQGWPLDLTHVTPHNFYSITTCPGDLDLGRIIVLTQGGLDVTADEKLNLLLRRTGGVREDPPGSGNFIDLGSATLTQDEQSFWGGKSVVDQTTEWPVYTDLKARLDKITSTGGGGLTADQAKELSDALAGIAALKTHLGVGTP